MRRRFFERLRRGRGTEPPVAVAAPAARGLGEPPVGGADDAELDALRGELVRELDRMASGGGDPASFRRS